MRGVHGTWDDKRAGAKTLLEDRVFFVTNVVLPSGGGAAAVGRLSNTVRQR